MDKGDVQRDECMLQVIFTSGTFIISGGMKTKQWPFQDWFFLSSPSENFFYFMRIVTKLERKNAADKDSRGHSDLLIREILHMSSTVIPESISVHELHVSMCIVHVHGETMYRRRQKQKRWSSIHIWTEKTAGTWRNLKTNTKYSIICNRYHLRRRAIACIGREVLLPTWPTSPSPPSYFI
jgi:hypothetical protein